ncbi:MAG: hypothetical protein JW797_09630 [Bradymonadales bacterium]|nr:hypothetical protein [Bradymonadales bacterium]
MSEKPELQRTRRDSGPLEVVSEQRDDGTYEIKFQSKEVHPEASLTKTPEEVEAISGLRRGQSAASYAGLVAVVLLLAIGAWFLFISPQRGDRHPPAVSPPAELDRAVLQQRYRLGPDMSPSMPIPELERGRERTRRIDSSRSSLQRPDASTPTGASSLDMGSDAAAPPVEPPPESSAPSGEREIERVAIPPEESGPLPIEDRLAPTRERELPVLPMEPDPELEPAEQLDELGPSEYLLDEETEAPFEEELLPEDGEEWDPAFLDEEEEEEEEEGEEYLIE